MARVAARRQQSGAAPEPYERPAAIKENHVILNPDAPARWHRFAVKDDHPLTRAYEQGKLASGRRDYSARDRWLAGLIYRGLYEDVHASATASSNLYRVSGGGSGQRASESICAARDLLNKLNAHMGGDNAFIVQRVCGDGVWPHKAVSERYAGFEKMVSQTLCYALDALVGAVIHLRLHDRKIAA